MPTQGEAEFDAADPLGCDLLWTDDLDPAHRLESGTSLLAHDIFARWTCRRGLNPDDADYGLDVIEEMLSAAMTPSALAMLPKRLEAEARKDDRVDTISVTITQTATYAYKIVAVGKAGSGAPFRLVASVADAYARVLEAA